MYLYMYICIILEGEANVKYIYILLSLAEGREHSDRLLNKLSASTFNQNLTSALFIFPCKFRVGVG